MFSSTRLSNPRSCSITILHMGYPFIVAQRDLCFFLFQHHPFFFIRFASFPSILHLCIHSTLHPNSATLLPLHPPTLPSTHPTNLSISSPPTSHDPSIPDINNNKSIGAEVKQHLNEAKDEAMTEIQHIKNEAKTDVAPQKAWWGLGLFGASQGGSESPREGEKKS